MANANAKRMLGSRIAAKLSTEQARDICVDPRPNRAIERAYGISHGTVSKIKRGISYATETKELRHGV
jgi:uncharacterized protein YerC